MNSKRTFQALQAAITIGALALSVMQAQAQVVSPPYGYFGTPNGFSDFGYAGNNISVLGSPYGYGGFVTVNPNGSISVVSPDGTYNPFQSPYGFNGDNFASAYGRSGQNNQGAQTPTKQSDAPLSLSQQIGVKRDNSYGFTFGWRGDPSLLANMTVTLLNRYHLPIMSGSSADGSPVAFAGNTKTYAARYYRVEITYADGAVASMMGTVQR